MEGENFGNAGYRNWRVTHGHSVSSPDKKIQSAQPPFLAADFSATCQIVTDQVHSPSTILSYTVSLDSACTCVVVLLWRCVGDRPDGIIPVRQRIWYKLYIILSVKVSGSYCALVYLADICTAVSTTTGRHHLRSAARHDLIISRTRLFPVRPRDETRYHRLSPTHLLTAADFSNRLKTELLAGAYVHCVSKTWCRRRLGVPLRHSSPAWQLVVC